MFRFLASLYIYISVLNYIYIDRLLTPSLCTLRDMTCMWAYVHASYMLFILHQSLLAALVFTARQKSVVARTRRTFALFLVDRLYTTKTGKVLLSIMIHVFQLMSQALILYIIPFIIIRSFHF